MPSIEEFAEQHGITVDELLEIVNNTVPLNDLKNKITEIQEIRAAAANREKWLIAEAIHEHGMAISQLAQVLGTSRQNTHAKWNTVPRNKGPLPEWPALNTNKEDKEYTLALGEENWRGFLEGAEAFMVPERFKKLKKSLAFDKSFELYCRPESVDEVVNLLGDLVTGYLKHEHALRQQQEQEQEQENVAHDTDED